MYDDPEYDEYDDDEYHQYPYNEYGYPKEFNIDWAAWEKWLSQAIQDIVEENDNVWIFGNYKPSKKKSSDDTTKKSLGDKYFAYLGNNKYDEPLWKTKYFINDKLDQDYKNHIASHAAYFLQQPSYYRGMFDNLN